MDQALFKSASLHFYQIYWSLLSKLSRKKSLLVVCQILWLFVNILAADDKYAILNRDRLTIPIR